MKIWKPRSLTKDEARAIAALHHLASGWPPSLKMFSWSGSLVAMGAAMRPGPKAELAHIHGIQNDGGDPNGRS